MPIKVFWSDPVAFGRESLRRYASRDGEKCPGKFGYHDAEVILGEVPLPHEQKGRRTTAEAEIDKSDQRWPKKCEYCEYAFNDDDTWQRNLVRLYEGGGKKFILREAPVGAMWDAEWMPDAFGRGADGIALIVMTPGGDWHVDSRASNCTLPNDDKHKCWVRHGDPRTGIVHVDKNGNTCQAGGGSIMMGNYHGFLHNGYLTSC